MLILADQRETKPVILVWYRPGLCAVAHQNGAENQAKDNVMKVVLSQVLKLDQTGAVQPISVVRKNTTRTSHKGYVSLASALCPTTCRRILVTSVTVFPSPIPHLL